MLRLPKYEYHRPRAVDDALLLLSRHLGDALPIAGGTDLIPNMKHGLFTPGHLIALHGIAALRGIERRDEALWLGPAEALSDVARHPLVRAHTPSLAEAAGRVAGPQLRAMGTIGGNLCLETRCAYYNQTHFWRDALGYCLKKDGDTCHVTKVGKKCVAAHSADTAPVLITLAATAELSGPEGRRDVSLPDFFVADGIWNSVRRPDEIVTGIRIPLPPATMRTAFQKLRQRNSIDFPLLNVAVACDFESDGATVRELRIVVSGLGARPRALAGLDTIAHGERLSDDVIEAVAERAFQQCHPLTNIIVDTEWRRAMVPVHVRRALSSVAAPPSIAA